MFELYGISAVPVIILIDPNGVIVCKAQFEMEQLDQKLTEIFK